MVKSETGKDFEAHTGHSDYNSAVITQEYFAAPLPSVIGLGIKTMYRWSFIIEPKK